VSDAVDGPADAQRATVHDVGLDNRRPDVRVAGQFLNRADGSVTLAGVLLTIAMYGLVQVAFTLCGGSVCAGPRDAGGRRGHLPRFRS
jgi:hypothetical protein